MSNDFGARSTASRLAPALVAFAAIALAARNGGDIRSGDSECTPRQTKPPGRGLFI